MVERIFRVDKMRFMKIEDVDRVQEVFLEQQNLEDYSKRAFNMFKGTKRKVTIQFSNDLLDTMVERLDPNDEDTVYTEGKDNTFTVNTYIEVSDQFFSWVAGFRKRAEIIQPKVVRNEMMKFLADISEKYTD